MIQPPKGLTKTMRHVSIVDTAHERSCLYMSDQSDRKPKVMAGTRKVFRIGGSLAVSLPAEFVNAHNIKEGDDLPFAANNIIKYIPVCEER